MTEWISVKDRLPEKGTEFLSIDEKGKYNVNWFWDNLDWCHFTHWMPLPKPPEEMGFRYITSEWIEGEDVQEERDIRWTTSFLEPTLHDADGGEILCGCGNKPDQVFIGKECYRAICAECLEKERWNGKD